MNTRTFGCRISRLLCALVLSSSLGPLSATAQAQFKDYVNGRQPLASDRSSGEGVTFSVADAPTRAETAVPNIAVSMHVLQQRLESCAARGGCGKDLLEIGGITRVDGYVVDDGSHDLLLFGAADPGRPPLRTEDLVVALRNAWHLYVTRRGNVRYYSSPGCSIDPDSGVLKKLEALGRRIRGSNSTAGVERGIEQWNAVCGEPQGVRVLGIPFDVHFAAVMVHADYDMKRLVNGSDSLEIEGFSSLTDVTMSRIRSDLEAGRPVSVAATTMNRFWFSPGENRYGTDEGIVRIEACPVILLTEEEHLARGGQTSGTGHPDPLAETFARGLTSHFAAIAAQRPIYAELEGLFRLVSISRVLRERGVEVDLQHFLEAFVVPSAALDSTVPGLPHVADYQNRRETSDGYVDTFLWLPSCGGVSIDVQVSPGQLEPDRTGSLRELRAAILDSRPSADSLAWRIPG